MERTATDTWLADLKGQSATGPETPPAAAADDAFQAKSDRFVSDLNRKRAARDGAAVVLGTADPEAVAEGLRIGGALGLPENVVRASPEVFRRQLAQRDATVALEGAPLASLRSSLIERSTLLILSR